MSDQPMSDTSSVGRGCLTLIDSRGVVVAASMFKQGDPESLNEAVAFVNDGRRPTDQVRRFVHGERILLGKLAPRFKFSDMTADCDLCDGWHPEGDHGSSNAPNSGGQPG